MTKQVYEDGIYVLEWYEDDEAHLFSVSDMDGNLIKEYRTDNEDAANNIWEVLCNMMDYTPEELVAFRLKDTCGRNIARVTDILVE